MPVDVIMGTSPLILAIPHASTQISHPVMQRLNETGRALTDTAWHIDRLYKGLVQDETVVRANIHRYVCDTNGNPNLQSRDGKGLITVEPPSNFDGDLIWDNPPEKAELSRWRAAFHTPYHATLATQIARVRSVHGFAVLVDCHAKRSKILSLFDGVPPDISISTNMGAACDHGLAADVGNMFLTAKNYKAVINDRSNGGYTVRTHGRPKSNVHALQIELSLSTYLTEEKDPWLYDEDKAEAIRAVLKTALNLLQNWRSN